MVGNGNAETSAGVSRAATQAHNQNPNPCEGQYPWCRARLPLMQRHSICRTALLSRGKSAAKLVMLFADVKHIVTQSCPSARERKLSGPEGLVLPVVQSPQSTSTASISPVLCCTARDGSPGSHLGRSLKIT